MKSLWNDSDAEKMIANYAAVSVGRDLALRVYSTRLLGSDPRLVLHGGGNTSVKTVMQDALGSDVEVVCVKGSGWDMGNIEPPGLPAVRLAELRKLRALDALSDEEMVNQQRINLLDSKAPNPSVEALLHAFMPHKFIDHTHSTAVLAISDQPDAAAICKEVYGSRAGLVAYVMPGFDLAKKAAEVQEANPDAEGLILLQHGIFSFGETAKESYERMIALVSLAEEHITRCKVKAFPPVQLSDRIANIADVVPILRGLISECVDEDEGIARRMILDHRVNDSILAYVNGREVSRYSQLGVVTPDHVIRTKRVPLVVPAPEAEGLDAFREGAAMAVEAYVAAYHAYFARNSANATSPMAELDPMPRVILVPGVGLFGAGASAKHAAIAADIAENTVAVITDAEAVGSFQPVSDADLFDLEYWSLEQAKLGSSNEAPLARHVVLITGGGSGIGAATADAFAAQGAEIAILDRDAEAAHTVASAVGGSTLAVPCDVTDPKNVREAFDSVCARFGGVDIVISNAGAAWQGRIGQVSDQDLRASFELNFFAHQSVAQNAVRVMLAQGTGGVLLFNTSKQAVNPGPDFGPYGLPKAATLFLSRQYALEYGSDGIRSNAVNADRVRTGIFSEELLEERARARGLSVEDYLRGDNLLKREVTPEDVAQAFVSLALARKTTAAVLTVDGGNISAALR